MKLRKNSVYSFQHRHIPMTKTDYERKGSGWVIVNQEEELISPESASWILADAGLPFERSHRHYKVDRFGHSHPYDAFSSISPDGKSKTTWVVHFAQGERNFSKLVRKSYYNRMRYKARKNAQ